MKVIIVLSILLSIGLIFLMYKRENNLKKMFISSALLVALVSLGIVGTVMRYLMPLYLTHIVALIFAYGGLIIYILRDRFYWYLALFPVATLALYVFLAWVGNEHIVLP
jgi:cytochrome bd-type quinol oxidase subunit 2